MKMKNAVIRGYGEVSGWIGNPLGGAGGRARAAGFAGEGQGRTRARVR